MKDQKITTPTPTASAHGRWMTDKTKQTFSALAFVFLTFACAAAEQGQRTPDLPSTACDSLEVPAGNEVSAHVYALGVQIYRWNGTNWAFIGPEARLFADPGYNGQVGIHYAGPKWEANDGSIVSGVSQTNCTPFRGAIPWLRLRATPLSDRGSLAGVTYIQRVNTIGGTAPATAGAFLGDEARVPSTAEYYFYRARKQ